MLVMNHKSDDKAVKLAQAKAELAMSLYSESVPF